MLLYKVCAAVVEMPAGRLMCSYSIVIFTQDKFKSLLLEELLTFILSMKERLNNINRVTNSGFTLRAGLLNIIYTYYLHCAQVYSI